MPTGQIPNSAARGAERQAAAKPVAVAAAAGIASVKSAAVPVRTIATERKSSAGQTTAPASKIVPPEPAQSVEPASGTPLFGAGLAPSQSWLGRNKYVLGALVAIGAGIAGVLLLR